MCLAHVESGCNAIPVLGNCKTVGAWGSAQWRQESLKASWQKLQSDEQNVAFKGKCGSACAVKMIKRRMDIYLPGAAFEYAVAEQHHQSV